MTPEGLRSWMSDEGWSVRRLAHALGVAPQTVQRWRDGSRPVPLWMRWALIGLHSRPIRIEQSGFGTSERHQWICELCDGRYYAPIGSVRQDAAAAGRVHVCEESHIVARWPNGMPDRSMPRPKRELVDWRTT